MTINQNPNISPLDKELEAILGEIQGDQTSLYLESNTPAAESQKIVEEMDDMNVAIGVINKDTLEICTMAEVFKTVTDGTVISAESAQNLAVINNGKYAEVADKVFEEVSPVQGFTKEPSSIHADGVKKILDNETGEKHALVTKAFTEFMSNKIDRLIAHATMLHKSYFPGLIQCSKEAAAYAESQLLTTLKNNTAFLIPQFPRLENYKDEPVETAKIIDQRDAGFLFFREHDNTYPEGSVVDGRLVRTLHACITDKDFTDFFNGITGLFTASLTTDNPSDDSINEVLKRSVQNFGSGDSSGTYPRMSYRILVAMHASEQVSSYIENRSHNLANLLQAVLLIAEKIKANQEIKIEPYSLIEFGRVIQSLISEVANLAKLMYKLSEFIDGSVALMKNFESVAAYHAAQTK